MSSHFKLLATIIAGLSLGIFFGSCKPAKKKPAKTMSKEQCNKVVSSALGSMPTSQVGLTCLSLPKDAIDASSNAYSGNTPSSTLGVDYSQLCQGMNLADGEQPDLSPTFLMWKACTMNGKTCSNNGQFKKSYDFIVDNLTLPKGLLQLQVKLCVDNIKFIATADQSKAVNSCTADSPCYCGNTVTTQYMNNDDSTKADPAFATALANYQKAQQTLLTNTTNYINSANQFANTCKSASQPVLTYAANVAAYAPTELATYIASYGDFLASMMSQAASSGSGLHLDDPAATPGSGSPEAVCNAAQNIVDNGGSAEGPGSGGGDAGMDDTGAASGADGAPSYDYGGGGSSGGSSGGGDSLFTSGSPGTDYTTTGSTVLDYQPASSDEGGVSMVGLGLGAVSAVALLYAAYGLGKSGIGGRFQWTLEGRLLVEDLYHGKGRLRGMHELSKEIYAKEQEGWKLLSKESIDAEDLKKFNELRDERAAKLRELDDEIKKKQTELELDTKNKKLQREIENLTAERDHFISVDGDKRSVFSRYLITGNPGSFEVHSSRVEFEVNGTKYFWDDVQGRVFDKDGKMLSPEDGKARIFEYMEAKGDHYYSITDSQLHQFSTFDETSKAHFLHQEFETLRANQRVTGNSIDSSKIKSAHIAHEKSHADFVKQQNRARTKQKLGNTGKKGVGIAAVVGILAAVGAGMLGLEGDICSTFPSSIVSTENQLNVDGQAVRTAAETLQAIQVKALSSN